MIKDIITESKKTKSVTFTFGRFNPPHVGHNKLFNRIVEHSRENFTDHVVFISQTVDKKKNLLSWNEKIGIIRCACPGLTICTDLSIKTPYQALDSLKEKYDQVFFVIGNDRIEDFEPMRAYAQKIGIQKFDFVCAGERLSESNSVEGASSSKMRALVQANNYEEFRKQFIQNTPEHIIEFTFYKLTERNNHSV